MANDPKWIPFSDLQPKIDLIREQLGVMDSLLSFFVDPRNLYCKTVTTISNPQDQNCDESVGSRVWSQHLDTCIGMGREVIEGLRKLRADPDAGDATP